jgi:hypothetical protein
VLDVVAMKVVHTGREVRLGLMRPTTLIGAPARTPTSMPARRSMVERFRWNGCEGRAGGSPTRRSPVPIGAASPRPPSRSRPSIRNRGCAIHPHPGPPPQGRGESHGRPPSFSLPLDGATRDASLVAGSGWG